VRCNMQGMRMVDSAAVFARGHNSIRGLWRWTNPQPNQQPCIRTAPPARKTPCPRPPGGHHHIGQRDGRQIRDLQQENLGLPPTGQVLRKTRDAPRRFVKAERHNRSGFRPRGSTPTGSKRRADAIRVSA